MINEASNHFSGTGANPVAAWRDMMDINGIILEPYRKGWVINYPYIGKDKKTGGQKTQYKKAYFSKLGQCLQYIRDSLAKDCTTAQELVALLTAAEAIDETVLARNGLIKKADFK